MNGSDSANSSGQASPGLNCPQCGFRIRFSIESLLTSPAVACRHCGLKLTVDRSESRPALDALQRLYDGIQEAHRIKSEPGGK
jgi:DNA-directed RNA polymerase subunit RPC12/RpoP